MCVVPAGCMHDSLVATEVRSPRRPLRCLATSSVQLRDRSQLLPTCKYALQGLLELLPRCARNVPTRRGGRLQHWCWEDRGCAAARERERERWVPNAMGPSRPGALITLHSIQAQASEALASLVRQVEDAMPQLLHAAPLVHSEWPPLGPCLQPARGAVAVAPLRLLRRHHGRHHLHPASASELLGA